MNLKPYATLIQAAKEAQKMAYCPYSRYPVGAAVLTQSGKIFAGCNIESLTLISHVCAERAAIYNAFSHGERGIRIVCTISRNSLPCGTCRQMIEEFGSPKTRVLSLLSHPPSGKLKIVKTTIAKLLPHSHTAKQLKKPRL
ncbi:MAG: cytidine deaminase [Elusimicrobia bacterium]|nr:cytidine deaminase [Elusimicrobiota bacterium]